jgi:predicted metal-binding protein
LHVELPHSALGDEKNLLRTTTDIVALEGDFFKSGFYKAFLFLAGPCRLCKECQAVEDSPCIFPEQARPCMEGCGIDVFETVRKNGFSIETLGSKTDTSRIYCLLMVD